NYYDANQVERISVPSCGASSLPKFGCTGEVQTGIVGLTEIHAFSTSMVNEFRYGYMAEQNPSTVNSLPTPFWGRFGIKPLTTVIAPTLPHDGPPSTSITGFTGFANSLFLRHDPHWQLTDNFSWTRSKHTLKFGATMAHHGTNLLPPTTVSGSVSFTNTSAGPTTTYGVADVLLGLPASTSLKPNPVKYYPRV